MRALTPDAPVIRGTAQNPDVYFQGRESANPYYLATPEIVQKAMDKFAAIVGRQYHLFDYMGAPDADRVIVLMGSGAEAAEELMNWLLARGEKVGLLKVRLFRPLSVDHLAAALPATVKKIAVLDRTKEPGAAGEPLYQDVVTALAEALANGTAPFTQMPRVVGGRYGLTSKEFTPAMVKAVYDELSKPTPKNHFTVGIIDDVTNTSLDFDWNFNIEPEDVVGAVFWGLGSDGTVGANKNSIKIIGEETDNHAQGYFVYDSKKSGARTVSHLRFGPRPIHSTYLIQRANFIGVHQFGFLERFDVLANAQQGAVLLLNSPYPMEETWDHLPRVVQEEIITRQLKVYVIDAYDVAAKNGMAGRINTVMQTCFFAISGVLPREEAIARIKESIKKTYGKRGEAVVRKNYAAVDDTVAHLYALPIPAAATSTLEFPPPCPRKRPQFVQDVTAMMIKGDGDLLPVSALPADGTYPTGTTQWEKRNIALEVPVWDTDVCIQCGKCVYVCPHSVIHAKLVEPGLLGGCAGRLQDREVQVPRIPGQAVHAAGGSRRLHRLPVVRRSLPGQEQGCGGPQGDQHGAANAAARGRGRTLGLLQATAGTDAHRHAQVDERQKRAAPAAALRVLRRLRRLRRDALPQADQPVVRRPLGDRQRRTVRAAGRSSRCVPAGFPPGVCGIAPRARR
ncbi:MAG: 2-oxoacid:acceptor oxidoreductase family protein [Microthrixaceae bacterium]